MRAIASISVLVMAVAMSVLAAPHSSHASPEDDARLRAAIAGPEKPKDIEEVVRLLDKGANPNVRDEFGRTAVHYAAGGTTGIHGTGAIFRLLLAQGGDCCMKDFQGDTPLHFAVAAANNPLSDDADVEGRIRALLRNGADPNEPNRRGYTPFHFSAKSSDSFLDTVIINSLLQAGADPDAVAGDGNTPLHLAAGVPVILDSGHGHNFLSMGWDAGENTLTDDGIPGNDAEIVDTLLAGGANPNVVNDAGMTPLLVVLTIDGVSTLAVEAAVKSLLSAGADPNATRRDGLPPLHIVLNYPESRSTLARRMTQEGIALVEALLGAGADPDAKNQQGDTPLHVAVRHEWGEDMVEALLAGSADPCIRNHEERWVPEQLARGLGQKDVNLALQLGGGYEDDCEKGEEAKLGLDRDARRRIQSCLKTQGFDPGAPDGLFGPRTRGAISAWQETQGDGGEASGYLTQDQFDALTAACKSAGPTPICTDGTDTPCWKETANQPGCHIWDPYPAPEETVTWSGACVDGKASGKGEVVWRFRKDGQWKTASGEGELRDGKPHGHWVWRHSNGDQSEGPYVNGKRHGHWVWREPGGIIWEGPYVDGKLHGRWVQLGRRGEQWNCWVRGERMESGHPVCASTNVAHVSGQSMQATEGIALRSGPGNDYEEIGRLGAEQQLRATRGGEGWVWVETGSGKQGFVPLSALEEVTEPAVAKVEKPAAETEEPAVAEPAETKPEAAAIVTEPKCRHLVDVFPEQFAEFAIHDPKIGGMERDFWDRLRMIGKNNNLYVTEYSDRIDMGRARNVGLVWDRCWLEITNKRSCYVFQDVLDSGKTFLGTTQNMIDDFFIFRGTPTLEWSGTCENGVVQGMGEILYYDFYGGAYVYTATFRDGKREENVVLDVEYECTLEGRYEHGLKKGVWVRSCPPGTSISGVYEYVLDDDGNLVEHGWR